MEWDEIDQRLILVIRNKNEMYGQIKEMCGED
jgi:hypothetical protein